MKINEFEEKDLGSTLNSQGGMVISFWGGKFQKKFGVPYGGGGKKDRVLVKKLLKKHPVARIQELGNAFFHSHDPAIKNSDYSIRAFYFQAERLIKKGKG